MNDLINDSIGPRVSIIVVAHNEEVNLPQCLDSLLLQEYHSFQILVVDGNSSDSTLRICQTYADRDPRVKFVHSSDPGQTIAKNRNIGVQACSTELIAFTDADCVVPKEWLTVLVENLDRLSVVGVGGANIADPSGGQVMQAISQAQSSKLGFVGSIQGQVFSTEISVPSLSCSNALFTKKILGEVDGFNEKLKNMGEDYELSYKIKKAGHKLFAIPGSYVWHKLRNSWHGFAKNMFQYGRGRMRLMILLKDVQLKYLVPILFIIAISSSLLFSFWYPYALVIPFLYLLIICIYSITLAKNSSPSLLNIALALIILHFSYGVGEIKELIQRGYGHD
jgi:cellulose synthase/poly-beta-1,6-N-acetylglucosamine synthase-like glycosyltransferase